MRERTKWYVFRNRNTGVIENFYGTSTAADVHAFWHPELVCVRINDID